MEPFILESGPSRLWRRRDFLAGLGATLASLPWAMRLAPQGNSALAGEPQREPFRLHYVLSSSLYGETHLREILPEVRKAGAEAIDLWPKPHGSQREHVDEMGIDTFRRLLDEHRIRVGCLSRYDLGPFRLAEEIQFAQRLNCGMIVTGAPGPSRLTGEDLRKAIGDLIEKLKPTLELAQKCGVTIALENHGSTMLDSPDAVRILAELAPPGLGIALAPYHLPQDETVLAKLIRDVGEKIALFYMWQYGKGCLKPQPREDEFLQLPGRGPLDFVPILAALRDVGFRGYSAVFMHPYPRGRAICDTIPEVTAEIRKVRDYLDGCLHKVSAAG